MLKGADMMTPEEFWSILHDVPEPAPVFYRLYYSDDGSLVCYSMEQLPHNYIEIDADLFALQPHNIKIVDGKIKYIISVPTQKLIPGDTGTPCDPRDICVVVPDTQPHTKWSKQIRESN